MVASTGRYASSKAILGEELFEKVQSSRVLVVGFVLFLPLPYVYTELITIAIYRAGGIGCELIKNMGKPSFSSFSIASNIEISGTRPSLLLLLVSSDDRIRRK